MRRTAAALAGLPLLLSTLVAVLSMARGPFFQWAWTDPEYSYLLSALTMAERSTPHHIDHPGTPLQVLGAGVLRATDLLPHRPAGVNLRDRVLRDPEHYLAAFGVALALLCSLVLYVTGYVVWNATGSLLCALAFQLTPFLSWPVVASLYRVEPEPLLLAIGLCVGAGVVAVAENPSARRWPLILGILLGIGIATKILFAVVAAVPLVALTTGRGRLRFSLAAGLSLALSILPIWPEMPRLMRWLIAIGSHSGYYGKGAATVVEWPTYLSNLRHMPGHEPLMFALAGASLLLIAIPTTRPRPTDNRTLMRTLLAIGGAQVLLAVVVAKHPRPHYLIPGASLTGASLVIWLRLSRSITVVGTQRLVRGVLAIFVLGTLYSQATLLRKHLGDLMRLKQEAREASLVALNLDSRLVRGIRTSAPAAALQYGNFYAGGRYAENLRRLYPGFVIWDWTGLHHFGRPVPLRDHLENTQERPFFRYLSDGHPPKRLGAGEAEWTLETVSTFGGETLYRVYPTPAGSGMSAAFQGFFDAAGLGEPEHWGQQGSRGFEVRRGMLPATSVSFWSEGEPRRVVLIGCADTSGGTKARMTLDGDAIGDFDFPPAPRFRRQTVTVTAERGIHELQLVYNASPAAVVKNEPSRTVIFFRRFAIHTDRGRE